MKKLLFTCITVMAGCIAGFSQVHSAADSLEWNSGSFVNETNQETVSHNSTFKTSAQSVFWSQEDVNYTFDVASISGSWPDVSEDGAIDFEVSWNSLSGTLHFARSSGVVTVTMDFQKNGANIMPFIFSISNVAGL